jgi:tetratricopeptide (TPR) repeat protein
MQEPSIPAAAQMSEGRALLSSPARSALRQAAAALNLAEQYKQPLEMSLALGQMARCYRALKALGPAESYLEQALAWARTLGAIDQSVELLCLLAETSCAIAEKASRDDPQRAHAALGRTRDRAFEVGQLAGRVADPQWEIKVLLRISDVLDRCGDHDDAIGLQSRAMRLMYGTHVGIEPAPGSVPPES